jgi:UrcA family protein
MSQDISARQVVVSRPRMTLMMILCGILSATAAGAVSAATLDDGVPALAVKYNPATLDTDQGARALYVRLVKAAEQVCPASFAGSRLVSPAVQQCREQALAGAVHNINNSRLAAVYSATTKRG